MDDMVKLGELIAHHEIRLACARYCRGIDRGDAALVASVFHADASVQMGGYKVTGAEMVERVAKRGIRHRTSSHQIMNQVIVAADAQAVSESYFRVLARLEHDGEKYDRELVGRFLDRWERRGKEPFRIQERVVVWDLVRTEKVELEWPGGSTPRFDFGDPPLPVDWVVWGRETEDDASFAFLESMKATG